MISFAYFFYFKADTISSIGLCKSWINSSQESHDSIRDMEAKNLKLILNATERGQSIFKQYREKTVLSDVSRDILVNTIVDHFSARSVPMTMKDIITFSEQITILFPNEDMRYYCNRRNGKNPTGKLYDKATNIRRKIKKETGALSVAPKCQPTQSSLSEQASNNENDLAMKNWLCHNVEPWGDVVEKWTFFMDGQSWIHFGKFSFIYVPILNFLIYDIKLWNLYIFNYTAG
ncbi:uncharacterized protein LOC118757063 [Rhagoletis pomonella]|uniref:uncharacterized protein LOC118757063 n=1 Tax=Rhagoletis pomonella TaxID=28610 RepID=UPI0017868E5C|nr:uncharacterized protein LOC118757063 [Rhagoletis pomonella]